MSHVVLAVSYLSELMETELKKEEKRVCKAILLQTGSFLGPSRRELLSFTIFELVSKDVGKCCSVIVRTTANSDTCFP